MAFWNRKKEDKNTTSKDTYMEVMNNQLFKDVTQEVALAMMKFGITKQPALQFFHDDANFLQALVLNHTTNPQITVFKNQDINTYMFLCGMHAFGAGVYVTLEQSNLKKPISEFAPEDNLKIMKTFEQTDSYELALARLGIDVNSRNKQILDQIIITAINTAMNSVGKDATKQGNVWAFMQVLFNAGITMIMRDMV